MKNIENLKKITMYSGGAIGSDKEWEKIAKEFNFPVVNYTVKNYDLLTEEEEKETEDAYVKAVFDLGRRKLPKDSYAGKLVRRDYLQAKFADIIFAISTIIPVGAKNKKGYVNRTSQPQVDGGTAYAVQMAINLDKPVYVFDQFKNQWFTHNGTTFIESYQPLITTHFAGIGTRELNEVGKAEIRKIFTQSFKQ